jgi:hypothetical protein
MKILLAQNAAASLGSWAINTVSEKPCPINLFTLFMSLMMRLSVFGHRTAWTVIITELHDFNTLTIKRNVPPQVL